MSTEHFNGLTEAEQERLVIIAEECGEVVQSTCKILRHGYESKNPKAHDSETNRQALERELGDVLHAIKRMTMAGDLTRERIEERAESKPSHILPYLHHQPECMDDPARCRSCLKHIAVCECPF